MIHVGKNQSQEFHAKDTRITEYPMSEKNISGAVAEIHGRYPETGFALNKKSKELVYIMEGNGKIITEKETAEFSKGDVIYIDKNEKFAWDGNFTMFMATTPAFDPKQHKIISYGTNNI